MTSDLPAVTELEALVKIQIDWSRVHPRLAQYHADARCRLDIIRPVLEHPTRSRARGAALRAAAQRTYALPNGRSVQFSERTLKRWATNYEAAELEGLRRKRRTKTAPRLVLISRAWDKACPLSPEKKTQIASEVETHIRRLWRSGAPGWKHVDLFASSLLLQLSHAAGWIDANAQTCCVGRKTVERHRALSAIATKEQDAKRHFDHIKPRIRRTRDGLMPMDMVVGDVTPIDILLPREDGSTYTARLIAWLDVATNRLFYTIVFPKKGEAIKQVDVVRSFCALVAEWGMPRHLYLDNGCEYNWAPMTEGFRQLAAILGNFDVHYDALYQDDAAPGGEEPAAAQPDSPAERNPITRARPYNAPAKVIESIFSALRPFLAMIPGYIAGDRMRKKTHNVGKAPKPHPGPIERYIDDIGQAILMYHGTPQAGALSDKSPDEAMREFIAQGFKRTSIDPTALLYSFSELKQPKVTQGRIEIAGQWYHHEALFCYLTEHPTVRYAKWDPERRIILEREREAPLILYPDKVFGFFDAGGAIEQGRREKALNQQLRALKTGTKKLDLRAEQARHVATLPASPQAPAGPALVLDGTMQAAVEAAKAHEAPQPKPARRLAYHERIDPKTGQVVNFAPKLPPRRPRDDEIDPFLVEDGRRLRQELIERRAKGHAK